MDRNSQRRISKIESLLAVAQKKREEKRKKLRETYVLHARYHAHAVAAIVLSGEPKIDEPLIRAWERALRHYGINVKEPGRMEDQVEAARRLIPIIAGYDAKKQSARFTEIFRAAPGWLLTFTLMFMDAGLLKFRLPDKPGTLKWGSAGYQESRRYPLLPSGTMTDGDPVSDEDAQVWPFSLDMMKEAASRAAKDNLSREDQDDEDEPSPVADLVEDLKLALDVAENPDKVRELSRYEKLRLRDVLERLRSGDD
jgi:hypothetical protein